MSSNNISNQVNISTIIKLICNQMPLTINSLRTSSLAFSFRRTSFYSNKRGMISSFNFALRSSRVIGSGVFFFSGFSAFGFWFSLSSEKLTVSEASFNSSPSRSSDGRLSSLAYYKSAPKDLGSLFFSEDYSGSDSRRTLYNAIESLEWNP